MLFIPNFYSFSKKKFPLVKINHLETFQAFGRIIWLFEWFQCEDLTLTPLSPKVKLLSVKSFRSSPPEVFV